MNKSFGVLEGVCAAFISSFSLLVVFTTTVYTTMKHICMYAFFLLLLFVSLVAMRHSLCEIHQVTK
jgi:hypothetical protein